MNAEDLSPAEQSLIANTIVNQMRGYYRTGVIGTEPVIGAFPNGPMSISKRTSEAKQDFFREPAVQDEDGLWNKGPNRWQAHKIARGVAYNRLEQAREMGALTPGYRHRGSSGRFRRNPFMLGAEDFAAERKLMCAEHDDYFNACGCGSKNAEENRQPPWSATNPKPQRKVECGKCDARGYIAGEECDTCDGSGYWMIPSPNCATCDTYLQWDDGAECDDCDAWYCDNHLTEDGGCKVCGNTSLSFHSEDIPVWNDGIVEWETSGPMSPTGSGYSSASVPPTGVMAGPGDTFLNYTDAQNYLVESSGGLWGAEEEEGNTPVMPPHEFGQPVHWQPYDERITALKRQRAEEFAAMARIDPKNATDVKNVVDAIKKRYNKIKISRTEYITNRVGSSNKYHVFAFTNRGVFNGYGRIGKTMTIFGPMSESQGHFKLDRKLRQGYKETV